MKKLLLTSVLLTFFFQFLTAQSDKCQVFLKNGSIISGELMSETQENYTIKDGIGNIWVFNKNEVDQVDKIPLPKQKLKYKLNATIELGILIGDDDFLGTQTNYSIATGVNYRIKSWFRPGLGGAVNIYGNNVVTPIYAHFKGLFLEEKLFNPFYDLQVGYGFLTSTNQYKDEFIRLDNSGGVFYKLGLGVHLNTKSGLGWMIGLGYMSQNIELKTCYTWDPDNINCSGQKLTYNRTYITTGIYF